jgi:GDPmannose 4,6-dehydratase
MWLMLQQDKPDDFVIATGETHSIREWLDEVFGYLQIDWQKYVDVDPRYYRPTEVDILQGDASKARRVMGWEPRVQFKDLARMMIENDLKLAQNEALIKVHEGGRK